MPFANAISYLVNTIFDFGKKTTLPRGKKWPMSKSYFFYSELTAVGWEDFKFVVGQVIAAFLIFRHMIVDALFQHRATSG